ncbi:hypothetical protein KY285_033625 [Solanum tuberosum]|nr:hypothetical protein KY285_033625 [Solanum tuberosum]
MSDDEITIARVVHELRKAKDELKKEKKLVSICSEWTSMGNEIEFYRGSSVCNYALNNLDFGWGKPSRVTIPAVGIGNMFFFMYNQNGDGIEVIVALPEKDVTQFENNKELLQLLFSIK